ncbi:MAG TPA: hypothetical protein VET30_04305 [Pseudoxanthomonas sp.]|nr:hypothetical protein [Pseudoxanthomonas sp.]
MRTPLKLLAAAFLLPAIAFARDDDTLPQVALPSLVASAADAQGFVPPGWLLEYSARGDLDADRRDDLLLVLRMQDVRNVIHNDGLGVGEFDSNPRLLAVAFATDAGYRLVLQDDLLVPRPDSPMLDDYLQGEDAIGIGRGSFFVTLHLWASAGTWSTSNTRYTFRYQEGCFRMIGYDYDHTHRGSGQTRNLSLNYLTRKARIDTGSIEHDEVDTGWKKIPAGPLKCLAEVGNGFEFDPGVALE